MRSVTVAAAPLYGGAGPTEPVRRQLDAGTGRRVADGALPGSAMRIRAQALRFRIDERTDRVVIEVVDPASGEIIRQIPRAEMLALADYLGRPRAGLVVDAAA